MAESDFTQAKNHFCGGSAETTALNVANVLDYLSRSGDEGEEAIGADADMGRFLILQNCIEALRATSGIPATGAVEGGVIHD
ncbi:MAG: hypothetical protein JNM61_08795 [Zoogloeaceae bacterium]|nr:hypothetical protein [Zoogloeaceae bacterium]